MHFSVVGLPTRTSTHHINEPIFGLKSRDENLSLTVLQGSDSLKLAYIHPHCWGVGLHCILKMRPH